MERRSFIQSGLALTALGTSTKVIADNKSVEVENELYEWRTYDIKWGSNVSVLTDYLKQVLKPALLRAGANHMMVFDEVAPGGPNKIFALISYPNSSAYLSSQRLQDDAVYQQAAASYHAIPVEKPIYNRFSSSLLHAFDGMKQMLQPVDGATVYELRIYEGYSEDAVRRKIKMFNDEEFPLFHKVGLHPIFFGNMISGPHRPCLVYMLNFTDMDAHGKAWQAFLLSPEWNEMKGKPIYANTVSNIRNTFLKQI